MIHVLATIEVKPGQREAFLREFYALVPKVRAEVGCIEYGPTVDLPMGSPAQKPERENMVVVIEKWQSLDALKAHSVAPHMGVYRDRVKDLVLGMDLQVLRNA